jgi:signal transduction histidine kinase
LLVLIALTVAVTVGLVTWAVSVTTRKAFEAADDQRTAALVSQFRRELDRRADDVIRRVEGIAAADGTMQIAIDLARPGADGAPFVNEAGALASAHGLDFLQLVGHDGAIVSSAHWPARFGYRADWVVETAAQLERGILLRNEDLPDQVALAFLAVRTVRAGERNLYIAGGRRLDRDFLHSLVLPAGMRVILYHNPGRVFRPDRLVEDGGQVTQPELLAPLVAETESSKRETAGFIKWADGPETFQSLPLTARDGSVLGVLLIGSSRRELATLLGRIRTEGALLGGIGVFMGIALSYWVTARVTRPVEHLARGARAVAAGKWETRVEVGQRDEIGELAHAFNSMTKQLTDQRERLLQSERVAAWRELARRLAHELKNPLFPLQITIENLQRAKILAPDQFEEVFRESTATLLMELTNLKSIIGRFSDFARMPAPQPEALDLNEVVRRTVKLFVAQFHAEGRPGIAEELHLDETIGPIEADPEQLGRALRNLLLNAADAMPNGGKLTIRTGRDEGSVRLEVSDTGEGLTKEECQRLFTAYYTTKRHGTGLGLAIVQSAVADHHGKLSVQSERGTGTTFTIELPAGRTGLQAGGAASSKG